MNRIANFLGKIFLLNFLVVSVVCAQSSTKKHTDSIPLGKAESFFKAAIKQQSGLYNGTTYYIYGNNVSGSANFLDSAFTNGTVVYNGNYYHNVPLNYDLYIDKLVSVSEGDLYSLVTEKVSNFYIHDHHFVNKEGKVGSFAAGFYDLLYDGSFKILAKRAKKLQFSTNKDMPYFFKLKTTYYLERNQQYEEINGEGSFLSLFKDKKAEMKQQLASKKIKFNKEPEKAMITMAAYYDALPK